MFNSPADWPAQVLSMGMVAFRWFRRVAGPGRVCSGMSRSSSSCSQVGTQDSGRSRVTVPVSRPSRPCVR